MTLRLKTAWLLGLVLLCLGASGPPPLPKIYRVVKGPTQGSGALALIAKNVPAQPMVVTPIGKALIWDWSPDANNPATNIVFLVRSNSSLAVARSQWPVVAVTSTNYWPFTVDTAKPVVFFTVFASNTVSRLVSQ